MRAIATLVLMALVSAASADQFWVEYDASSGQFPEEVGWDRHVYGGGAERSFEDGFLVLDGLVGPDISDFYRMDATIALAPGERFVMQWRLRADEVIGFGDPGVNFTVLGQALLTLVYYEDSIYSLDEFSTIATFQPGLFHDYLLTSTDLDTYTLRIDGELVHTGLLGASGWESGVEWGDYSRSSSLSTWDSFAFGVVPEPATGAAISAATLLVMLSRNSRTRS
jgi:hypothetical protein